MNQTSVPVGVVTWNRVSAVAPAVENVTVARPISSNADGVGNDPSMVAGPPTTVPSSRVIVTVPAFSSVSVVLNSVLLTRWKPRRPQA